MSLTEPPTVRRRRVRKSLSRQFSCLSFYKEDLEKIIDVFSAGGAEVHMRTDQFEYDSAEEFWAENSQAHPIQMVIFRSPHVTITMQPWGARVESTTDEPLERGIVDDVCELTSTHRKWYYPRQLLYRIWSGLVGAGLCGLTLDFWFNQAFHYLPATKPEVALHCGLVLVGFFIFKMKLGKADIRPMTSREKAPILERQWAVFIAPAIIALIGILATHYWPPVTK